MSTTPTIKAPSCTPKKTPLQSQVTATLRMISYLINQAML